ncbi:MAG: prepilin-type N-terminal cleavage/methylation domain-containing protein [Synergistaceae bacterium]|nr:prepilin-type N-terminal cleavage/methylation domain-containing protein [Synergistaceae bacterium]MBR0184719.1 prepilin-type N-terminal cleavage/methylation domain-containing protein [Synergistaceae bacterium]
MTTNRGFTLIEILVAVMLTGLLTGLALAPVVVTVRRVVETQEEYTDIAALSRTVSFIARDLNAAMRLSPNVLTIRDHEALGGNDDDVLMVMSNSPTIQNLSAGTIVYKVAEGGLLHNDVPSGLYRWIMSGAEPKDIDPEKLDPEKGQLVLPGVNEFRVEVPTNDREDDNRKEYTGQLPAGVFIRIGRGEKDDDRKHIESIIAFP